MLPPWIPLPESARCAATRRFVALGTTTITVLVLGHVGPLGGDADLQRMQVEMLRKTFEHAVRLPLHRLYALRSGGTASLLREDAGGISELVFSMIYNPWRAVIQLMGSLLILAWD